MLCEIDICPFQERVDFEGLKNEEDTCHTDRLENSDIHCTERYWLEV